MENYRVNEDGSVLNLKSGKFLKQYIDKYGYKRVNVCIDGKKTNKRVHRLVAEIFIQNPKNKPELSHKDGCKTNNNVNNLVWLTTKENRNHAVLNGLRKHKKYEVFKNYKSLGIFNSSKLVTEEFKLSQSSISNVANGHYETTKGYKIKKLK